MKVTDEGMVREVKAVQSPNALCPIDVTDEGMVREDKALQL
jgi:hypothetical protein